MSYILDALRKADQQRKLGGIPSLSADSPPPETARPPMVVYGLFGLAILVAGMFIGWLRPWQAAQVASTPVLAAVPPASASTAASPPLTPSPVRPAAVTQFDTRQEAAAPPPRTTPVPPPVPSLTPRAVPTPTDAVEDAPIAVSIRKSVISEPGGQAGIAPAGAEEKLPSLAQLPQSIRQELPALAIAMHVYSTNPRDRLVGINNRTLQEGDELAPGLKLEEIRPNSLVFNYRGQRFRRELK